VGWLLLDVYTLNDLWRQPTLQLLDQLLFLFLRGSSFMLGGLTLKVFLLCQHWESQPTIPRSQRENRLNQFACLIGGMAIAGCLFSKWFMTPTHPTTFGSTSFFVPQRICTYVGWVDVKGFLIVPALRKSTHHSKESTGKQIKSICLSFWWDGYCWMSIQ